MIDLTKTYRTRDGREVTDLRTHDGSNPADPTYYPYLATVDGCTFSFALNGGYWQGGTVEDDRDLIAVETSAPAHVPGLSSEQSFLFRSEALGHAVRLPYMPGVNRSAVEIVKDAEAFYGFLTGATAA